MNELSFFVNEVCQKNLISLPHRQIQFFLMLICSVIVSYFEFC